MLRTPLSRRRAAGGWMERELARFSFNATRTPEVLITDIGKSRPADDAEFKKAPSLVQDYSDNKILQVLVLYRREKGIGIDQKSVLRRATSYL